MGEHLPEMRKIVFPRFKVPVGIPQEAADILNVSYSYLDKLLEQGDIPFIQVDAHRRIRLEDLMEYKERRDAQREKAIAEIAQMCQGWGIYD